MPPCVCMAFGGAVRLGFSYLPPQQRGCISADTRSGKFDLDLERARSSHTLVHTYAWYEPILNMGVQCYGKDDTSGQTGYRVA